MEYVFGTQGEIEVLKTKGDSHTDLTGFHQIEQTFPDQTITDNFRVVRKIESAEDFRWSRVTTANVNHLLNYSENGPALHNPPIGPLVRSLS